MLFLEQSTGRLYSAVLHMYYQRLCWKTALPAGVVLMILLPKKFIQAVFEAAKKRLFPALWVAELVMANWAYKNSRIATAARHSQIQKWRSRPTGIKSPLQLNQSSTHELETASAAEPRVPTELAGDTLEGSNRIEGDAWMPDKGMLASLRRSKGKLGSSQSTCGS